MMKKDYELGLGMVITLLMASIIALVELTFSCIKNR